MAKQFHAECATSTMGIVHDATTQEPDGKTVKNVVDVQEDITNIIAVAAVIQTD